MQIRERDFTMTFKRANYLKKFIVVLFIANHLTGLNNVFANTPHDMSELTTSEVLNSQSMEEAYPIYHKAINSLEFHQLGSAEWTGANLEEVKAMVQTEVEPYEATISGNLDFKMLLYPFGTGGLDSAEIGFLFAEDHLVFAALGNLMVSMDGQALLAEEVAEKLSQKGVTLLEITEFQPKIKAFGHVVVDGESRDMLVIDVGEEAINGATYFYFIEDGIVKNTETMDLFSAMQGTQTIMFDKLALYYANGKIGSAINDALSEKDDTLQVETSLDVDPLETLMTETTITNSKYVEAWSAYQQALFDLSFRDLASEALTGSKIDDVERSFDIDIKARRVDYQNSSLSLLVYTFESPEVNQVTGQTDIGEMALYFVDELLAYASVANRSFVIESERVLSDKKIKNIVSNKISADELAHLNPQVIAMGYMIQNKEPRSLAAIQTGDAEDNRQVSFLFIRDDAIHGGETYPLEEVVQDIQTSMFYSLGDFFVKEVNPLNE